jgi:hypothetical protein
MIKAAHSSPNAYIYKLDDLVKVSRRVLGLHGPRRQVPLLQPKYLGHFQAIELIGSLVKVSLPAPFSFVHNVFSTNDIRPWVSVTEQDFDATLPTCPNSALNPICSILDRKQAARRLPKNLDSLLLISAQYFVVRKSGECEWIHQRELKQRAARLLILEFERKYHRTADRRCEPFRSNPEVSQYVSVPSAEEPAVPDEVRISGDASW